MAAYRYFKKTGGFALSWPLTRAKIVPEWPPVACNFDAVPDPDPTLVLRMSEKIRNILTVLWVRDVYSGYRILSSRKKIGNVHPGS